MSFDLEQLSDGLEHLLEEPAPPSGVDIARLLDDGHRVLRRRRAGFGLSGAAAAGAAAVLAVSVLPGGSQPGQPGDGSRPPLPSADLVLPATFGWLPATVTGLGYSAEQGMDTTTASFNGTQAHWPVTVTVFSKSVALGVLTPAPDDTDYPEATITYQPVDIGTVDGSAAWYFSYPVTTSQPTPDTLLSWVTASGQQVQLNTRGLGQATALRIAQSVDVDPKPMDVPLKLDGWLGGLRVSHANLDVRDLPGGGLSYSLSGTADGDEIFITASVLPSGGQSAQPGSGGPMEIFPSQVSTSTAVTAQLNGITVSVEAVSSGKFDTALARDALGDITSLGVDQSNWAPLALTP